MASVLEESHRQELLASAGVVPRALGEMLGYYFRFYEGIYGRPCSAMHDPLAAALAVGAVEPALAPVVRAAVDTSSGPGRGQTVCDMRGLYAGYPPVAGARCRVVLSLEEDFAPHLVETLLGHFEDALETAAREAVTA
jgi:purine nucleosidase